MPLEHGLADVSSTSLLSKKLLKYSGEISYKYIPLISRVRGPYGKLWTEFFPSFYGPSAKCAGHENKEGKNEDP